MWYQLRVVNRARGIRDINAALESIQARESEVTLPRDFAIFSRVDTDANTVTFFFAPGAKLLADECAAVPCDRPPAADLELLAGSDEVWKTFPDHPAASRDEMREVPVPARRLEARLWH